MLCQFQNMTEKPFHVRVRRELDAMERRIFLRSALWMLLGGVLAAAVALACWIIL